VEVIGFVLDGSGEQAATVELELCPFLVESLDRNLAGAGNIGVEFGKAQAAFRAGNGLAGGGEFGIQQNERHERGDIGWFSIDGEAGGPVGDLSHVDHGELEGHSDLLGGEADSPGIVHGFEHVPDEISGLIGDLFDEVSLLAEGGVAVIEDG